MPANPTSELANDTATPQNATASAPSPPAPAPLWARCLMPSVADLVFLVTFWFLTFGSWGAGLLADPDTGWHIRNGEHILATRSIPHADYFSYTMAGRPWYAWEWLYDVVLGVVHRVAGLNGVVVLSALLIALTFMLLFRMASKLSGNLVIAGVLTLLSAGASSIHFLARPHLVTWLFVLAWFAVLDDFRRNANWKKLIWLPVLMLFWVNLHGGFLLGLVLPVLFATAHAWTALTCACPRKRARNWTAVRGLSLATLATFAVTFANPYGYRLYVHLREYLGSHFLMRNISEFLSPDFHSVQAKLFLLLLLTAVAGLTLAAKPRALDVLMVAFAAYAGLYAARNIPMASILLTLTTAPLLAGVANAAPERADLSLRVRRLAQSANDFDARMRLVEEQLTTHVLPAILVLAAVVVSMNHGWMGSRQLLDRRFDPKHLPVQAAEYLETNGIRSSLLTEDGWGAYLIYRFDTRFKVFMDDRHDFYGEPFLKDYLEAVTLRPNWRAVLQKYGVKFVLLPPDAPLVTMLRADGEWKVVHQDETAVVIARTGSMASSSADAK